MTLIKNNKRLYTVAFGLIMALAVILRAGKFVFYGGGLNQDEASIGYDAWALLHYGIDRNGVSMPVHLIAWGSGQNAMYAYLSMPFIAIFGLTALSVRAVNLIAGIGAVASVYFICKNLFERRTAFCAMALTAAAPWHIMLSTWGLESNLLPSMFIFALLLLVKSFKHAWLICPSAAVFSLCLYTYGSAYVAVPIFMLVAVIVILRKKLVPLKWIIAAFVVFVTVSVPIGLFVLVNKLGWESINIGPLTIPAMTGEARINLMTGSFSLKSVIKSIWDNVVLQNDGQSRNALPVYGCFYVMSLPFTVAGFIKAARRHCAGDLFALAGVLGGLCIFFVLSDVNINRVNFIYMPLIILTSIGFTEIIDSKRSAVAVVCAYAVMLSGFTAKFYGREYTNQIENEFFVSFDEAIEYADQISADSSTVHVTGSVNMPYIYVLFYTREDPNEYIKTAVIENPRVQFQFVNSFGKWVFNTDGFENTEPGIYIVENSAINENTICTTVRQFEKYTVVTID